MNTTEKYLNQISAKNQCKSINPLKMNQIIDNLKKGKKSYPYDRSK
jgi:hypothetical protein